MKYAIVLISVALLSGCGADGDPIRPDVTTGVSINSNGTISTSTSVSATTGDVSVTLGL